MSLANSTVSLRAGGINPALSEELRLDIEHLRAADPDEYEHVYEGMCRQAVQGAVYRNELLAADKRGPRMPCTV